MVEVFKTNVSNPTHASKLVHQIHKNFSDYRANFDLDDCDKILRVKSFAGPVQSSLLINFLNQYGFTAEVLDDSFPVGTEMLGSEQFTEKVDENNN